VLRFLNQTQANIEDSSIYPSLKDSMNLILLDEMNLAHVELYFSDFLSQLEERRKYDDNNVPELSVKMGADSDPFKLPLGRNVLWVGTMNQDETTKTLSDKVIDRSLIIYFPRPKKLASYADIKPLQKPADRLPYKVWKSWIHYKTPDALHKKIQDYHDIFEKINDHLSIAGRALGHRVWQSIEFYMFNYPDALSELDNNDNIINETNLNKALKTAFEDQLVEKVMPKLRGIDTAEGSKHNECLSKIEDELNNNSVDPILIEDFRKSREMGYGQFIWSSSDYLNDTIDKMNERETATQVQITGENRGDNNASEVGDLSDKGDAFDADDSNDEEDSDDSDDLYDEGDSDDSGDSDDEGNLNDSDDSDDPYNEGDPDDSDSSDDTDETMVSYDSYDSKDAGDSKDSDDSNDKWGDSDTSDDDDYLYDDDDIKFNL